VTREGNKLHLGNLEVQVLLFCFKDFESIFDQLRSLGEKILASNEILD
jgi:hypothetical protein